MTTAGMIFKGYVEAIVERYGFGSNKMVHEWDNKRRDAMDTKAQDLVTRAKWAQESFSIAADELEAALAGKQEGLRIWDEMGTAEKWLFDNGYLREYTATYTRRYGRRFGTSHNVGITAKGWAVADKYLKAE